jgi:hypothetical protein
MNVKIKIDTCRLWSEKCEPRSERENQALSKERAKRE